MAYLIRNALVLRTAPDVEAVTASLRIEHGQITAIDPDCRLTPMPGDTTIDGTNKLVTPGFVNAHAHSPLSLLKGTTDRLDHPQFMWQNQTDTAWRSDEQIEAATHLAAADMLRQGITSVIDHVPEQNATLETIAPVERGWRQVGMRAALALRIFDGIYGDIGAGNDLAADHPLKALPARDLLDVCEAALRRWHDPAKGLSIFIGPSNSERCSDRLLADGHALAASFDTGFHMHMVETRTQRESSLEARGITPVSRLTRLGALTGRTSLAHTIWVDDTDIDLLAESRAVVVHNPHSNLKLGAGIMPLGRMHRRGLRLALGTDGASTNDTQSLHEAMSLALLLQRFGEADPEHWLGADEAIKMAMLGGAAAFNGPLSLGNLEEGGPADLVIYNRRSLDLCPFNDIVQQLVFAERGRSIEQVMVAGRLVYENGRFHTIDIENALDCVTDIGLQRRETAPVLPR